MQNLLVLLFVLGAGATILATLATVLEVNGIGVCRLHDRVDRTWFVQLDRHLPAPNGRLTHSSRDCSSYEQGRAGCEIWAARHEERLRAETSVIAHQRAIDRGTINGGGAGEQGRCPRD